ncbi:MAG: NAD(P)-binding domain-containing protein [Deltaproteobacteria bacterium]|nr:NAD(P)-binding domain-containing protein [Deltaproteobacteria bacterium]
MSQPLLRRLFGPKRPEPSYPVLPRVDEHGRSSVPGVYVVGELAGTPLIKLGLNRGAALAERLAAELVSEPKREGVLDVVVIGAGSSGLGFAMRAKELGLSQVVLEAEQLAMTVRNMYTGKILFAEPTHEANRSGMWFEECTKEQLLERWEQQAAELPIREHTRAQKIERRGEELVVVTDTESVVARRVVLAVGKAGNPRKAGAPGESEYARRILHGLSDPSAYSDKDIFIYGGGDVAAEAALALCSNNRVTIVTIDPELVYPKKRNADALREMAREGKLSIFLGSKLETIGAEEVIFSTSAGEKRSVRNDVVFEMIGAEPPVAFLKRSKIGLEGEWNAKRWVVLALVSLAVYSLYALKKYPEAPYSWPFNLMIGPEAFNRGLLAVFELAFLPFAWMFDTSALDSIRATPWFQQGYLYSFVYTIVMIVFGWEALLRWTRIARRPSYQRWRYASLVAFQVVFFLVVNVVAVQALSIQFSWRAWGLYQPWPLFFNTFHWWSSSDPRALIYGFVGAGLFGTLVAIPWASYRHGKRFCTFVCGCGGLAETLGDRWRDLAPKGERSRAWEFQGAVVLVAALIVTMVTVGAYGTRASNPWALAYSYLVDFWLVAVIPIALYPFFGGKVWCRYWCPLAAFNQILASWYGRLEIKSNDKCISCGECSRYCQVGVDVMSFAKQQQPFDNRSSACIQCGICIDVCPMDVLSFDQRVGPRKSLPIVS